MTVKRSKRSKAKARATKPRGMKRAAAPKRPVEGPRRQAVQLFLDLSVKVFEPPLSDLRETGRLRDLWSPLSVLMLVVDFETEVEMNGVVDFLGNSTGRYAKETVAALECIGCPDDAAALRQIVSIATRARMTHATIQKDRERLGPFTVTTFAEVHGTKWQRALGRIEPLSDQLDFGRIRQRAEVLRHEDLGVVKEALGLQA